MDKLFCCKNEDPNTLVLADLKDIQSGDIVFLRCGYEEIVEDYDHESQTIYLENGNVYEPSDINPLGPFSIEDKNDLAAVDFEPPAPQSNLLRQTFFGFPRPVNALVMLSETADGDTVQIVPYLTDAKGPIDLPDDLCVMVEFLKKNLDFVKEILDQEGC